LRVEELSEMLH